MFHSFETLNISTIDGICTLTINRPEKLNALNEKVLSELDSFFTEINEDESIRGVIITGAGEKAFVAGADIKALSELDGESGRDTARNGQRIFSKIEECLKPVIAVVNGYALGGGTELALACHVRIGTSNAVFGLPEVSLGLIPGYGGTQRLTRLVGKGRALEMILTGRMVKADEALHFGILNRLEDAAEKAHDAATALLSSMLKHAPLALGAAIKAVNASESHSETGYAAEANFFGDLCETEDFKEGTGAFLEKRKPSFSGK